MKKVFAVVLALMLAVSMTAMASADAIKLAVIGPITGAAGVYGSAVANGAAIAAQEINEAAGETVIELIVEDDAHDAETSIHGYDDALDKGAQAVIGTVTTTPCIAVSAKAYEDRVFMLTPSASSTAVTEDKDNCYQLCFTDPAQGTLAAQYINENSLGTTVGVIYNNGDAYSTGIYQTFVAEMEAKGVAIAATAAFNDGTTDFSVQVAEMKAAGCDVVFLPIYYTPAAQILKQAVATDYAPLFFGVDGMDGILTLDGFDASLAEGVMLLTPFVADSTSEDVQSFVAKYQAQYGETPNQFAADGYDCVYAMYAAFQAAGLDASTSPEDACEALIATFSGDFEFTGVTGTMTWDASGAVTKTPNANRIKNGVYVSPENY